MNEILDMLMEDDDEQEIYIEPPDVRDLTDEDSGDENLDGNCNADKLSRGQLMAPAELRPRNREVSDDPQDESANRLPSVEPRTTAVKRRKVTKSIMWTKGNKSGSCSIFPEGNYSKYSNFSPVELFELFFNEDILQHVQTEMTKYSLKRNWPDVQVQISELKIFLAILLLTGYNTLPQKHMYWSKSDDVYNSAVANAMRRDRFDIIMKCMHLNASDVSDTSDKYIKMRPLIVHLQKKFMEHFVPSKNISHDEAMVKYFGKHGCKQAIRNKPIRFGYKVWCQNTPSGYLCAFDVYQGKTYKGDEEMEGKFGKCSSTVLHLLSTYSVEKTDLPYHFFFDNLFTSMPLLHELRQRGYDGTGTLRGNRLEKLCPVKSPKSFDKDARGAYDAVTGKLESTTIMITRWKDNAIVTAASTLLGENPTNNVRRWSKKDCKHIQVSIPHVIHVYNQYMGGTDRMDQNINAYRIAVRGKKWWWPLFTWLIDVAVQNAWLLARCTGKDMDQLTFRRDLVMAYLLRYQNCPKAPGRKPTLKPGEKDARFDLYGHFIEPVPNDGRRRCALETCSSRTRSQCCKCLVGLCMQCFRKYHTN